MKLLTKDGKVIDDKCKNGKHVYHYNALAGSVNPEPPDGTPCQCGQQRYRSQNRTVLLVARPESNYPV